jgi:hypothetical protein
MECRNEQRQGVAMNPLPVTNQAERNILKAAIAAGIQAHYKEMVPDESVDGLERFANNEADLIMQGIRDHRICDATLSVVNSLATNCRRLL